jgi:hypothetical protein
VASALLDSLNAELREGAWEWLETESSPGYSDPALWSRILETPFEDLRLRLIGELRRRHSIPGASPSDLAPIWISVLLGVHRGGRSKGAALAQIAAAVVRNPDEAERLLPVVLVALRSIRGPEHRAALAAVAQILDARPELTAKVKEVMPELEVEVKT